MTDDEKNRWINDFITRSFRDVADQDYIAARILYRATLGPQFLWAAHQAIEKYLKAILLYSRVSTKDLGHDLEKALARLKAITDIPFDIPDNVRQFIGRLNEEGPNRYFEYPAVALGKELLELDQAVWYLRRYCYPMRGTYGPDDAPVDRLPLEIAHVHAFGREHAHQFRISGGFLERVLAQRKDRLRAHLVWKNFFYGARRKRVLRPFTVRMWSATPTHYLKPEIFDDLDRLVRFSEPVRRILRAKQRTTPTD